MKTIDERARETAWQIYEETILSQHSVDRVAEIIAEKMQEQKAIDLEKAKTAFGKACGWLSTYLWYNEAFEKFMKIMEEEL